MTSFTSNIAFFKEGEKKHQDSKKGLPGRIPVCSQMHEFAMKELGVSPGEFYITPELIVTGTLQVMQKDGIDMPYFDFDVYNIEAEALGQEVIYSDDKTPELVRSRPLIRDRKDLRKIRTPNFDSDGRFIQIIEMHKLYRKYSGGTEPDPRITGPFTLAATLRGLSNLLMDIYTDPDFVCELLDRIVENVLAPWALRLKKEFPNLTGISADDAMGSLPIVNLDILKNWIIPNFLRLQDLAGPEIYIPNWVGEHFLDDPEEMLNLKNQVCQAFVEGQDPDIEKLGVKFYRDYAQKKNLPLVLGVGATFLDSATPDEVAKRVLHYIKVGGKNGKLILLLCNLSAATPPENVRAAMEVVKTFKD